MKRIILSLIVASVISGCASQQQVVDCATMDWRSLGYVDGSSGKHPSNIDQYIHRCADQGVQPDILAYDSGHYHGSLKYCTLSNGFAKGREGAAYHQSCPEALEQDFMMGYRDGHKLHSISHEIETLHDEIHYYENTIRDNQSALFDSGIDAISGDPSAANVLWLALGSAEMIYDNDRLRSHINFLQGKLQVTENEYSEVKRSMSHYFESQTDTKVGQAEIRIER